MKVISTSLYFYTFILGLIFVIVPRLGVAQEAGVPSVKVEIPVLALLTPVVGYEEKNLIEFVVYGVTPDACYTISDTVTYRTGNTIHVKQYAIKDQTGVCATGADLPEYKKKLVPFKNEIKLGHLSAGEYEFLFQLPNGIQGTRELNVSKNVTQTVDSLPYAATSNAFTSDYLSSTDDLRVVISGVLNSSCTRLDEHVKIMYQKDVFVLLPTIKVIPDVVCAQAMIPFEKEVNVGKVMPGVNLVHVRSMNGSSINKVVVVGY